VDLSVVAQEGIRTIHPLRPDLAHTDQYGQLKQGVGFNNTAVAAGVVALAVGLLTLYSMTKIWAEVFWKAVPEGGKEPDPASVPFRERALLLAPVVALAGITLAIGFFPQFFFDFADRAAAQLLNPENYIRAVLEGGN
jgi:multicomponent Na+:H+ antiporter subunit D